MSQSRRKASTQTPPADDRSARPTPADPSSSYTAIYAAVRRVPRGKVASYGLVALVAGLPGRARQVGYALHALPTGSGVPWHRVLNARGEISLPAAEGHGGLQRALLEKEGVRFDAWGRVDLDRFGWKPRGRRR
ncbi:MAG: MGMT family protein [Candidatus Eisenbacteria bacterium]|nr:MGMT family protein [Candidatus Eisenbacteria bacterium]